MRGKRGFIGTVIIIAVIILAVSYYGFDLRQVIESPTTKKNFAYVWQILVYIWNNFLVEPFAAIWHYTITLIRFIADVVRVK
ncbi:MAG: hypothetical protein Q7S15_00925 [bacterium]|nr:hypothetical protein [bacterium]